MPPLFNGPEVLSSASDKAKLFATNFSKNSNCDGSGVSLPVFPSRTNLKLHNISVIPKMIKKVITKLDLSKASGPDHIPLVVLENCESDCWKVLLVVPVFKYVGERSSAKNFCLVSLLSVSNQGIIQKKSVSGSRTLPLVIFDKKCPFSQNSVILRYLWVKLCQKYPFLKIPDTALKF